MFPEDKKSRWILSGIAILIEGEIRSGSEIDSCDTVLPGII